MGVIRVLEMLLKKRAKVDAEGGLCWSALAGASSHYGHEELVDCYWKKGPTLMLKTDYAVVTHYQQHHVAVKRRWGEFYRKKRPTRRLKTNNMAMHCQWHRVMVTMRWCACC